MTNRWTPIENRLHEESALHYPDNTMRRILEPLLNGLFDAIEEEMNDIIYECFLLTSTGQYLDLFGVEIGLTRENDESDNEYRQRLFNALSEYLSVSFVKLQGIILYAKEELYNDIRINMTSQNPYMSNIYAGIPRNDVSSRFLLYDMIYEYTVCHYVKGW